MFLTSLLVRDHAFIVMILKPYSSQKRGCQKMIFVSKKQKFWETNDRNFLPEVWLDRADCGVSVSARSYVTNCLFKIFDAVAQHREKTGLRRLILQDDNARLHWASITTEYLARNRIKTLLLPVLSSCNFFLFQKLKKSAASNSI